MAGWRSCSQSRAAIKLILVDGAEAQFDAEARGGGLGIEGSA